MTAITKTSAKTYFVTSAKPTEAQFADLIDSFVGRMETSAQSINGNISIAGNLTVTSGEGGVLHQVELEYPVITSATMGGGIINNSKLNSPTVSAGTLFNPTVSAGTFYQPTLIGVTTNTSAAAGQIGETQSGNRASGSALSLTTANPNNVTSVARGGGVYLAWGAVHFVGNTSTTVTDLIASLSTTSSAVDSSNDRYSGVRPGGATVLAAAPSSYVVNVGPSIFSIPTSANIYLVCNQGFGVSTASAYGKLNTLRIF